MLGLRFTAAVGATSLLLNEIPTDWLTRGFLDGLGTVGTWTLIGLLLVTDKGLALKREVTTRDKTIEWQRLTITELNSHNTALILSGRASATAMDKIADAAVALGGEGG